MRAEVKGDRGDGPAVVFLPGMDGTGELLLDTASKLEAHFRLLRFCYVDEGLPGSAATYERLADTAAGCLADAGVRGALILAESFGGGVALQLALRHPQLVRGLALVNTFAWFPNHLRARLGAALFPWTPTRAVHLARSVIGRRLFFRPRRDAEAEAAFLIHATGFEDASFAARMKAVPELDLRDRLAEIHVPCRLYASTHDRVVPSRRTMATLAQGLPQATLELIPRANHIVLPLPEEPWAERLQALDQISEPS